MLAIRRATASTVVGCHHHLARGGDPHKLVLGVHRGWNQSSCFGRLQSILPKNMTSSPPQKNCRTTCTCLSFPTTVGAGDMDATGNNVPKRNALTLVAATNRATATSSSAALHGFLDWMSRIISTGGSSFFANTSSVWNMSSTLKKRRAKMNKHKLRKRRKRERRKTK